MSMPLNIQDWRTLAQKRLPRFAFDFIDGAAEDTITLKRNRQAFERIHLLPRVLKDTRVVDTSVQLLGSRWSAPLGIAPMGLNGLVRPGGDTMLAKAAQTVGVPFVLSTASNDRLEHVRKHAPSATLWLQLYVMQDAHVTDQLLRRAKAHDYETLILTVDVPVSGNREKDHRNGFRLPFRLTPRLLADLATHPRWSIRQALAGQPAFVNLVEDLDAKLSPQVQAALLARTMDRGLNWARLDEIRQKWPGRLLLKGILHPDDARLAVEAGVDGLWSPIMEAANWMGQAHHLMRCLLFIKPLQGDFPFCWTVACDGGLTSSRRWRWGPRGCSWGVLLCMAWRRPENPAPGEFC